MTQTNRRTILKASGAAAALGLIARPAPSAPTTARPTRFRPLDYGDVELLDGPARAQFEETRDALLAMDEDALLRPFRVKAGLPAPGVGLGGWYDWSDRFIPGTDMHGFIPGHSLGQYISALARMAAADGDVRCRDKVARLVAGLGPTLSPAFFHGYTLPAYTYDKLLVGLLDAHAYAGNTQALGLVDRLTDAALPSLPEKALTRPEMRARPHANEAQTWDESYTLPENLYRAWEMGAGGRYRTLARRYLHDKPYFDPLATGANPLVGEHAYSHVNALASAMKAWAVDGDAKHLAAATNGLRLVEAQSFATGGWGPNEAFVQPGTGALGKAVANGHNSFETPCGCYGHYKVARALIAAGGDARWGDAMERLLYNGALGVPPLRPDGVAFYYSDYNDTGAKTYFEYKCPCCSGTIGQLVADYGISSYLRDDAGLAVNLYVPSRVRWRQRGRELALVQRHAYPLDPRIDMTIEAAQPTPFDLRLRIPAWATAGTILAVNGVAQPTPIAGRLAAIRRTWTDGDRVTLTLPMPLRLEAVDAQTPHRVALVAGPLALFQTGDQMIPFRRADLLAATRSPGQARWTVASDSGQKPFRPFFAIARGETTRLYQAVAD